MPDRRRLRLRAPHAGKDHSAGSEWNHAERQAVKQTCLPDCLVQREQIKIQYQCYEYSLLNKSSTVARRTLRPWSERPPQDSSENQTDVYMNLSQNTPISTVRNYWRTFLLSTEPGAFTEGHAIGVRRTGPRLGDIGPCLPVMIRGPTRRSSRADFVSAVESNITKESIEVKAGQVRKHLHKRLDGRECIVVEVKDGKAFMRAHSATGQADNGFRKADAQVQHWMGPRFPSWQLSAH